MDQVDKKCVSSSSKGLKIIVKGRVQGVGFRPFIYSLSKKYKLTGTVQNNLDHVTIFVEGNEEQLNKMVEELNTSPPKLSKIDQIDIRAVPTSDYSDFSIIPSEKSGQSLPWLPYDAAICDDCVKEINDPNNRRYQYPFINCTQCGPRYTIINKLPYDRPNTTMNKFRMCPDCKEEYEDPMNRRHHAQPVCCYKCGPAIALKNQKDALLAESQESIYQASDLLKQGKILGIKGLGGYHIVCDAYQEGVIAELRRRKNRPQRPLAVMVRSLEVAQELCYISESEKELITSSEMPIVILNKKEDCQLPLNLSPGLSTIGIMLPYTPLHHLLFLLSDHDCLVMTSANMSGRPIQYSNESIEELQEICDYFLTHDRDILHPIDDSVVQQDAQQIYFMRRARGFVPEPIKTNFNVDSIIALGGNQKNTFAIGKSNYSIMSPHIGDLENEETVHHFENKLEHFKKWLSIQEKTIAVDQHPLYTGHSIAEKLNGKVISTQHHHAHHVSCMIDNGLEEPCLGIILDGTGYGDDGHIWGYEFLYGDASSFNRLAHLKYTPLPGNDKAVIEPWRNAVGMILHYWPYEGKELADKLFPEKSKEISIIQKMINKQINTPLAGTCGRLFDAVSAILGVCQSSTYEGEPAIKLSDYMNRLNSVDSITPYPFHIEKDYDNKLLIDMSPMLYEVIMDKISNKSQTKIIAKFHQTIIESCTETLLSIVKQEPNVNKSVVLSGGSFQNIFLNREIKKRLQEEGFNVYTHQNVPCHDGGLSLGQLVIASQSINK